MQFTKDDLRAAYLEGFGDGFLAYPESTEFDEDQFDVWFEFVFKDRLDEEQAYYDTKAEIFIQNIRDSENPLKTYTK